MSACVKCGHPMTEHRRNGACRHRSGCSCKGGFSGPCCQCCGAQLVEGPTALDKERYAKRLCGGCQ